MHAHMHACKSRTGIVEPPLIGLVVCDLLSAKQYICVVEPLLTGLVVCNVLEFLILQD